MTGSHSQKTSRATSSSPKLNPTNSFHKPKTKDQESLHRSMKPAIEIQNGSKSPMAPTPLKSAKRNHQAIVSPITTRSESASPKAKFRSLSSPLALLSSYTRIASPNFIPIIDKLNPQSDEDGVGNPLAVPKISAEPPSPSLLPNPPKHWVGEKNARCLAMKQQCKEVTNCLMTHLASSGILVSAQ